MDVGDDRHRAFAADLAQGARGFLIGRADPDDIGARIGSPDHLIQRRTHVVAVGVGHRLHADRRVTAHRHIADHDLAGFPPLDIAPGTDRVQRHAAPLGFASPDKPSGHARQPPHGSLIGNRTDQDPAAAFRNAAAEAPSSRLQGHGAVTSPASCLRCVTSPGPSPCSRCRRARPARTRSPRSAIPDRC